MEKKKQARLLRPAEVGAMRQQTIVPLKLCGFVLRGLVLGVVLWPIGPAAALDDCFGPTIASEGPYRACSLDPSFITGQFVPVCSSPCALGLTDVSVGGSLTCGLREDGSVVCWGQETTFSPAGEYVAVAAGGSHACGILADGTVDCWGEDSQGQASPPSGSFTQISAGHLHTCGLRTDASITCWGSNVGVYGDWVGQSEAPSGSFLSVSAGGAHTCALRSDGTVECWGDSAFGATVAPSGEFVELSAGLLQTCGIRANGDAECWGQYPGVHAPAGSYAQIAAGSPFACGLLDDGALRCWGTDFLIEVGFGVGCFFQAPPQGEFVRVAAGSSRACALTDEGEVLCWGDLNIGPHLPCAVCGDRLLTSEEQCDDGNVLNGDGCDENCKPSFCGNGAVAESAGEQCDDANTINGDGCDANCRFTSCGNGIITAGELCDDGNSINGDGCTSTCRVEHDADRDGVDEDGDHDGVLGNSPCFGGQTTQCDDNCPNHFNPDQLDGDGDGDGDACDQDCRQVGGPTLQGTVYAESVVQGNELPGMPVQACKDGCCADTLTDGAGNFVLDRLNPGSYTLRAMPQGPDYLPTAIGPVAAVAGTIGGLQIVVIPPREEDQLVAAGEPFVVVEELGDDDYLWLTDVVARQDDGFVVFWQHEHWDVNSDWWRTSDRAQGFAPDATPLQGSVELRAADDEAGYEPWNLRAPDDGFYSAWTDNDDKTHLQRYDPFLMPIGERRDFDDSRLLTLSVAPSGGVVVALNPNEQGFAHYAQAFDSALAPTGSPVVLRPLPAPQPSYIRLGVSSIGTWLVSWNTALDEKGLTAFGPDGAVLLEESSPSAFKPRVSYPSVTALTDDLFVVVWQGSHRTVWDPEPIDTAGMVARIFDRNGQPLTTDLLLAENYYWGIGVVALPDGDFVAAWVHTTGGSTCDLRLRRFGPDGLPRAEVLTAAGDLHCSSISSVSADAAGSFLVLALQQQETIRVVRLRTTASGGSDPVCGDGVRDSGEDCDDGNTVDGDGCDHNCTLTGCGNAIVTIGEQCDDGNSVAGDGCEPNCAASGGGGGGGGPECRDGVRGPGEQCDDGNAINGDGCDNNCKFTGCGNDIVTVGEECDDGNLLHGDGCDGNCRPTGCGNGVRTGDERCDDGNLNSGDGCDANCTPTGCGNGIQTGDEQCDDGNFTSGDGCDLTCRPTGCGSGVRTGDEQCDDGNDVDTDACPSNCRWGTCGDGWVRVGIEQCDDANSLDGDGCDNNCRLTGCPNGVRTGDEECDDGNLIPDDFCSVDCTWTVLDRDHDLISEDGSHSGVSGDSPCATSQSVGCDDNCPYHFNPDQKDTDLDGVGDRCDFNCTGAVGTTVTGRVLEETESRSLEPISARVQLCKSGCCMTTQSRLDGVFEWTNVNPGDYSLTAYAPKTSLLNAFRGPFPLTVDTQLYGSDLILERLSPPAGAITFCDGSVFDGRGEPTVTQICPLLIRLPGCPGGESRFEFRLGNQIVQSGVMVENPEGTYSTTVTPGGRGTYSFHMSIQCPDGTVDDDAFGVNVWIDPSGTVNFLNGEVVPGADVTLLRSISESPEGPFSPVPAGSDIMSPQNRTNPDTTTVEGRYGWDVIAGFYQVQAQLGTCIATSDVLTIPPAVTELSLPLNCLCSAGPVAGCTALSDGAANVTLKRGATPDKRTLIWKWRNGGEIPSSALGNPRDGDSYAVCLYGVDGELFTQVDGPPGGTCGRRSCWKSTLSGFEYKDPQRTPNGLSSLAIKAGPTGKASVSTRAGGMNLALPSLDTLEFPLRVQLQRVGDHSGTCWESVFVAPRKHSSVKITAKVP